MKNYFPGYYLPQNKEFQKLWNNCIFILDANVLLNLYRYPKQAREDLLKLLKQVSERLWMPHYAALEYQRNRLNEIASQKKRFNEIVAILDSNEGQLKSKINQLQLRKRHSVIDPDPLLTQISELFSEFKSTLTRLDTNQPSVFDPDEIRIQIDKLLKDKIGNPPENQDTLDTIYKEGIKRYELKIPPGYMDAEKAKSKRATEFHYGGLTYQRQYGDLLLWKQIITETQEKQWGNLVFITDDDKEDWWWIINSQGDKRIGPRPELVEEITRETHLESFYMYNTERFLQFGQAYLKVAVSEQTITQVRDVAEVNKPHQNFRIQNLRRWEEIIRQVFPFSVPKSHVWHEINEIVEMLNIVGDDGNLSHLLFPTGGGLDLWEGRQSNEDDCVELNFGGLYHIVKPLELMFESFGEDNLQWAYFRLTTRRLDPTGIYDSYHPDSDYEELVELEPTVYIDRSAWDSGTYGFDKLGNEKSLPDKAKLVIRNFEGTFVIFAKTSIYNRIPITYDGRHNKMTNEQFRLYIEKTIKNLAHGQ